MSTLAISLLIALVMLIIIANILLIKQSAKFGLKNKDGSDATSHDDKTKRQDNNAAWDEDD